MQGKIKRLTDRGFGFIGDDEGEEFFFHAKSLDGISFDELRVGDRVQYETEETEKGLRAIGVTLAE